MSKPSILARSSLKEENRNNMKLIPAPSVLARSSLKEKKRTNAQEAYAQALDPSRIQPERGEKERTRSSFPKLSISARSSLPLHSYFAAVQQVHEQHKGDNEGAKVMMGSLQRDSGDSLCSTSITDFQI